MMLPQNRSFKIALVAATAGLALLPAFASAYYVELGSYALISAMLALSLQLLVGATGIVSLGHAAFYGLAAYTVYFVTPEGAGRSILLTLPLAVIAAGVVALAVGSLSLRTRGFFLLMVTLAFGQMIFFLFHDTKIGGGSDGMYINMKPEVAIGGTTLLNLDDARTFYFLVLAVVVGAIYLIATLVHSPFGRALSAARDNERRTRSLGFPVMHVRLVAFVISGALAGLAGYLSAAQFGFVAPQMLGWHLSATVLVMVVLGGTSSIVGPLFGALALIGLEEALKSNLEHWKLVYGLIVIAMVFALPGGLQQLTGMLFPPKPKPASLIKEAVSHA